MKPISLKLKGLNSFMEEQIVDFARLTEMGLFGVFGPTGSGKSTLLDAMTLALYGKTARGGEFVNKNSDVCRVSFNFSLSAGHTRTFLVEREYRKNKAGDIRTAYAKLTEMIGDDVEVLEDKANAVTKKCEEIIGLGAEDFLRTVVLPQGKFSEFLKLTSGPRREMLERLFNLETYGVMLTAKVAKRVAAEKGKLQTLQGQLIGYETVNEEALKALETTLNVLVNDLRQADEKYKAALMQFQWLNSQHELWSKKQILLKKIEAHQAQHSEYEAREKVLERDNLAREIAPSIQKYREMQMALTAYTVQLEGLTKQLTSVEAGLKAIEQQHAQVKLDNDANLPQLKAQMTLLGEGLNEVVELNRRQSELKFQAEAVEKLKKTYDDASSQINAQLINVQSEEALMGVLEKELETLQISEEQWTLAKLLEQNLLKMNQEKGVLEDRKAHFESLKQEYDKYTESMNQNETKLKLHYQKRYQYIEAQFYATEVAIEKVETERGNIERELVNQKNIKESQRIAVHKNELRKFLIEGEPCPVCGSCHHDFEAINHEREESDLALISDDIIVNFEKELQNIVAQLSALSEGKNRLIEEREQIELAIVEKYTDHAKDLLAQWQSEAQNADGSEVLPSDIWKRLRDASQAANDFEKKLAGQMSALEGLKTRMTETEQTLKNEQNNYDNTLEENDKLKSAYALLSGKAKESIEIAQEVARLESEKHRAQKLQQELKDKKEMIKVVRLNLESAREAHSRHEISWVSLKSSYAANLEGFESQLKKTTERLGTLEDVEKRLEGLSSEVANRESTLETLAIKMAQSENEVATLKGKCHSLSETLEKVENQKNALEVEVNQSVADSIFESDEDALKSVLNNEQRNELRNLQGLFEQARSEMNGQLAALENQIQNEFISEEALADALSDKNGTQENYNALRDLHTSTLVKYDDMKVKLKEMSDLIKEKERQESLIGQLNDLSKLFEARKFVAFMASRQLKYVCKKASVQLHEITNGVYSLEADEEGNFSVRDFKNGGQSREIATLSGGETFLVSLALALALSAQIQLKGTAPLELFFLDEGFGTLDDQTLDVVMGALESLPHEKLSIGLISHVESIKNRVPIKVNLEAAKAGFGGSKLKIELT